MAHIALKLLWSETKRPSDRYKKICCDCPNIPNAKNIDPRCIEAYRLNVPHCQGPGSIHVHPEFTQIPNPPCPPCWELNFLNSGDVGVRGKRIQNPAFGIRDIVIAVTRNLFHSNIPRYPIVAIGKINRIWIDSSILNPPPSRFPINPVPWTCCHGPGEVTMIKLGPLISFIDRGIYIDHLPYFPKWGRPLYKKIDNALQIIRDLLQKGVISSQEHAQLLHC